MKVFPIFDPKRVVDFEDDFPVGKHDFEQDLGLAWKQAIAVVMQVSDHGN